MLIFFYCRAFLFGLILLLTSAVQSGADKKDEIGFERRALTLTEADQAAFGIQTFRVSATDYSGEYEAIAKVIGIEPLLALRSRYTVARAELKSAGARLNQVTQSLKRHENLFRDGISPKRSILELTTQKLTEQAAQETAQAKLSALVNEARLNWGPRLSEWILSGQPDKLSQLFSGRKMLLQVILPPNQQLPANPGPVMVEPSGRRERAIAADFIAPATQTDYSGQGESYYFLCENNNFRVGMKMTAWVGDPGLKIQGVIVPGSALIWYMGQTFIYTKLSGDQFVRRELKKFKPAGEGYFVQDGLKEGEAIVSTGAQMLLSQEMRQHIPDED